MRYGDKIKKDPSCSLMKDDRFDLDEFGSFEQSKLERKHILILLIFAVSYISILIAVQTIGWGLIEMSACFIGVLIIITKISGMTGDESMAAFTKGLEIMIARAREMQKARFQDKPNIYYNAQMPSRMVREVCQVNQAGLMLVKKAMEKLHLLARALRPPKPIRAKVDRPDTEGGADGGGFGGE